MDPHPHFTALIDRLHAIQLAQVQSPNPLAGQIEDLKRHWAHLALIALHVPTTMAPPTVAIHGRLNQIPLLASSSPTHPRLEQQREIKSQVEQGLRDQLVAVVEHGLGQEITSLSQLSTATHRLLTSLPPPISSPTGTQSPRPPPPASADHLALSLSSTLTQLTSLLSTHTSLSSATATSTHYFSRVAQVALAKLDLLAATVRAHDSQQVTPLARVVSEALEAKKLALERELAQVKGEIGVYVELGPEFTIMCREVRQVRAEVERVKAEVKRLRSTAVCS
ncbi:hypothetical protein BCR44DRAFT_39676 [Catenaria anguillulae PL171]|uniref:Uncharacterized protein n=1 Tax=Catenaria anguillulae PL171 TaxID=765915 RepID=A0A1Y2HAS9_9FUNG|nr:hypothetical protein BCR44DRAFT_39676 [Catenaria anguillulae PL171]